MVKANRKISKAVVGMTRTINRNSRKIKECLKSHLTPRIEIKRFIIIGKCTIRIILCSPFRHVCKNLQINISGLNSTIFTFPKNDLCDNL